MVEISWKSCGACQHASQGRNLRSNHWNFNFFYFLETKHPGLSRDTKINSIRVQEYLRICYRSQVGKIQNCWCQRTRTGTRKVAAELTWRTKSVRWASKSVPSLYLTPQNPRFQQEKNKKRFWAFLEHFSGQILSLFSSLNSLPHTSKNLWFLSFLNNQGVVFLHSFSYPWS